MSKKKENPNRGTKKSSLDSSSPIAGFPYRRLVVPILVIAAILLLVIGIGSAANRPFGPSSTKVWPTVTPTAPPSLTVDPCSPDLIRGDVEKVHALMLEFYDASALASETPAGQLLQIIPNLQEIRRRAQALKVSHCLDTLRSYQISHMNMVINTLLAFMGNSDQGVLVEGIVQARLLNEEYKKEKARLLGETYIPPATRTPLPTQGTVTLQVSPTP
jgi:hypothetical protein